MENTPEIPHMPEAYPTRKITTSAEMARARQDLEQLLAQEKSNPFATLETAGETTVIRLRTIPRSNESALANSQFEDQLMDSLEALLNQVTQGTSREVVVDLARIDHTSQEIFGKFVALRKKLGKERSLRIINASPATMEMASTTRINMIFEVSARPAQEELPETIDA